MISKAAQTVSELNKSIKLLLENSFAFVTVVGELSNLRTPYSGHQYFSLKDANSQIKCVLFKMQKRYLSQEIADGMQVICSGRVTVYEPRGDYQLIIDSIDFVGAGDLHLAFEKLKIKLAQAGLFKTECKQKLPFMPTKVAVISSPKSAAIQDFLKVSEARCPSVPIDIYPARVQGEHATLEVIAAIETINKEKCADVIVICRGGGSIEDLWPFNDEQLAYTIFNSDIPIVSAIGHEIDYTIADFTADHRAPTPTAAVEAVMPNLNAVAASIQTSVDRLSQAFANKILHMGDKLAYQRRLLNSPINNITTYELQVDHLRDRMVNAMQIQLATKSHKLSKKTDQILGLNPIQLLQSKKLHLRMLSNSLKISINHLLESKREKLRTNESLLQAISPLSVLERGYAIVKSVPDANIVSSSEKIKAGDSLEINLAKGELSCEVTKVSP